MPRILVHLFLLITVLSCNAQQHEYTNALINETSPYLLQHAHNPVNWNPWKEETLAKAKEDNKMIVISVGYAACHWCHVMEEESFEDAEVATLMNENFVSIKVDREERPDVDAIYMSACQLATDGACGWPLNVFALPDGRPVWAGTYFPKKQWMEILEYFVKLYQEEPEKLDEYASRLTAGIQSLDELEPIERTEATFSMSSLEEIAKPYMSVFDDKKGGRKGAPKFPVPNNQEFLLQWNYYTGDEEALDLLNTTLLNMAKGGIYDHLSGGFARYSTDEDWIVPHFEKMLYDNAQLVSLYAKAYAATNIEEYQKVVEESLAFVARELSNDKGGFFSSLDADSEGEEGKFYVWTTEEISRILGNSPETERFKRFFQIKESGNWEDGKNILYHKESLVDFAKAEGIEIDELKDQLQTQKAKLLKERDTRVRPGLDDKVLTSWNALMLQGYIDAYRYLGEKEYLEVALKSASFLLKEMKKEDGQLLRTYKDGASKINAFLDDYAFLAQALISLYEVTFDEQWLHTAKELTDYAIEHFYDNEKKIFNYTSDLDPPLIARKVELIDNVIPGSNSVMGEVLYQLSLFLYQQDYQVMATDMLLQVQSLFSEEGNANFYSNWLQLQLMMTKEPYEVAIVGKEYKELQMEFQKKYLPNALFLGGPNEGSLELLKSKLQKGETFIYVCKNRLCKLPVQEVAAALGQM